MATSKQTRAAKRNVQKAQETAADQKTIAHLPAKTGTALGKQGAAVAQRKRRRVPQDARRAVRYRPPARPVRALEDEPETSSPGSSVKASDGG